MPTINTILDALEAQYASAPVETTEETDVAPVTQDEAVTPQDLLDDLLPTKEEELAHKTWMLKSAYSPQGIEATMLGLVLLYAMDALHTSGATFTVKVTDGCATIVTAETLPSATRCADCGEIIPNRECYSCMGEDGV
jgi:hypothetical protein